MNVNNISNLVISKHIIMNKEFMTSRTNPCKLFLIYNFNYIFIQIQIKWLGMQEEKNEPVYFQLKWRNKDLTQVKSHESQAWRIIAIRVLLLVIPYIIIIAIYDNA